VLLALAAVPWAVGVANPIQDVDPAEYADVSRHIANGAGWLNLQDSLGPFVNKPPLSFWAQAVAIKALGATSSAARLPAVLFALLALWGTFALGRALFNPVVGSIAACLLAACVSMHQMVADPKVDLALTAMATLALWAFVEGARRPRWLWLGWAFAGLAVLSKGPLGLALAAVAIAPEALRHRWGTPERGTVLERLFALKPVRGLVIVGAISAPYYWAVYQRDGAEGAGYVLWKQNVGRLMGESGYHNDTTPLFFLHTALWAFAPFAPLLIAAFISKARAFWKSRAFPPRPSRILLWGFGLPFVVFSLSDYKLPQYIFCLAPLGALLSAELICGLSEQGARRARAGLALLGALAAVLIGWWVIDCFPPAQVLLTAGWLALAALMPLFGWVLVGRWSQPWQLTAGAVSSVAALHLVFAAWIFPQSAGFQMGRELAERARREDPSSTVLPFIDVPPTFAVSYYAQKRAMPMAIEEVAVLVHKGEIHTAVVAEGAWPDFAAAGLRAESIDRFSSYPTSRPKLSFLRSSTRASVLEWRELVRVSAR
jgi:4-amino-4-deoxy-L-arabinose transferase-like glycosyltransferase